MTVLMAGCLSGALIAMTVAASASAQEVYGQPGVYAGSVAYPYGHPWVPHHAYRKAVRYGFVPVAPPPNLFHGPTDYFGCPFYGPPYYAYPRPPLGYPGYAGFSGSDPNAYEHMVPPPIPTQAEGPTNPQPTPSPEQAPTPPPPPSEPIPAPPSLPASK
jgi:hypothetical protein